MYKRNAVATSIAATYLLLGGVAIAADTPQKSSTAQATDDAALLSKIKTALVDDEAVKARQINVEVNQGRVQLLGFVDTPEQKAAAGRIASNIAGGRNVANNLEVKGAERSAGAAIDDGMITSKVKAALIGDSRTKAYQINVDTREGVVNLGGFVDNATAKAAASELAQSVNGVRTVQNRLEVKSP